MKKVEWEFVRRTAHYEIRRSCFKGIPITFRIWCNGVTEIRADNNLARANGYRSMPEWINATVGLSRLKNMFGEIPVWMRVADRKIFFCGSPKTHTN